MKQIGELNGHALLLSCAGAGYPGDLMYYWNQWKRPGTRHRHLMALGISKDRVKLASRSRKGYWRMSGNSVVQCALTNAWLKGQGVPDMRAKWVALHYPDQQGV